MDAKNILIFTAVNIETRTIQQAMRGSFCRIIAVGIGARRFPSASDLRDFIAIFQIAAILVCGVAGGLDPMLAVGDVILDDPTGLVADSIPHRRGSIHSATRIVSSPAEKAELFSQTGALAVDMEQEAVRNFTTGLGIPVVGIRAISDTADQTLDPVIARFVDDWGFPKPGSIAMHLIRRPSLIPYLRRLNKNTKIALVELGKAVRAVVDELEGS